MKVLIDLEFDSDADIDQQLQEVVDYIEDSLASSAISCKVLSKAAETQDIRDGYHSFKELYDHRIELFISLCRMSYEVWEAYGTGHMPWKSKKHHDGTAFDGWFIAGFNHEAGKQITYHLPIERWDDVLAAEIKTAPEFDKHTPEDVLKRLRTL